MLLLDLAQTSLSLVQLVVNVAGLDQLYLHALTLVESVLLMSLLALRLECSLHGQIAVEALETVVWPAADTEHG